MPNNDGTGPRGRGPMTGRGMGLCGGRLGFKRGYGRGWGFSDSFGLPELTKEEQKSEIERAIRIHEERIEMFKEMLKQLK